MEKRIEKWESLRLEAQSFAPQEYCDSCWDVTLHCLGQSGTQGHEAADVYPFGVDHKDHSLIIGTVHYNGHVAHDTPVLTVHIEGDELFNPDHINQYDIVSGDDLHEEVGTGQSRSGQESWPGYYWFTGSDIHFATSLNYAPSSRANAS